MNIELESLVGEHELSGAFFDAIQEDSYGRMADKKVLYFTLDGKNYEAVSYESDGYRDSLERLCLSDKAPQNTFAPAQVIARMKPKSEEEYAGEDYILQFLNPETQKPILEIGTADIDDYYPGFVAYFSPENLPK